MRTQYGIFDEEVATPPEASSETKTFTQEEVNNRLEEQRKELGQRNQGLLDEISALKSKETLTGEEKGTLQGKIDELQSQLMSKEEMAEAERVKLQKQIEEERTTLQSEKENWEKLYKSTRLQDDIKTAAKDAYNPTQILNILRPNTEVVEVTDDEGNPTGNYKTVVSMASTDKENKSITLKLSPEEAIAKMKENESDANLFIPHGKSGFGRDTAGGKEADAATLAKNNPAKYRELRKTGKIQL